MPPTNKKDMDDNNSNKSTENVKKSDLDAVIKDVKIQIRRLFGGYKEQIERIGNVLKAKRYINEEDICTEIKNALREEIKEKIISSDTIERCCPDEWKRKASILCKKRLSTFIKHIINLLIFCSIYSFIQ